MIESLTSRPSAWSCLLAFSLLAACATTPAPSRSLPTGLNRVEAVVAANKEFPLAVHNAAVQIAKAKSPADCTRQLDQLASSFEKCSVAYASVLQSTSFSTASYDDLTASFVLLNSKNAQVNKDFEIIQNGTAPFLKDAACNKAYDKILLLDRQLRQLRERLRSAKIKVRR